MAGAPDTAAILDALNITRASARERQGETERRIREEARRLAAEGGTAGEAPLGKVHVLACRPISA